MPDNNGLVERGGGGKRAGFEGRGRNRGWRRTGESRLSQRSQTDARAGLSIFANREASISVCIMYVYTCVCMYVSYLLTCIQIYADREMGS
jgi:hypothetical protein